MTKFYENMRLTMCTECGEPDCDQSNDTIDQCVDSAHPLDKDVVEGVENLTHEVVELQGKKLDVFKSDWFWDKHYLIEMHLSNMTDFDAWLYGVNMREMYGYGVVLYDWDNDMQTFIDEFKSLHSIRSPGEVGAIAFEALTDRMRGFDLDDRFCQDAAKFHKQQVRVMKCLHREIQQRNYFDSMWRQFL